MHLASEPSANAREFDRIPPHLEEVQAGLVDSSSLKYETRQDSGEVGMIVEA